MPCLNFIVCGIVA